MLTPSSAQLGDAGREITSLFDLFDLSQGMNHVYKAPGSLSDTENKVFSQ